MDLGLELFLPLHEAEVERGVRARRQVAALPRCRQRLLGIFPITKPCPADSRSN
jgi:hypothetical protein